MTPQRTGTLLALSSALLLSLFVACSSKEESEAGKVDVGAMTAGLASPDKATKINACVELGKAGARSAPAVSALIPLLKDPDAEVRRLAAYALGEIGPAASAALPDLKGMMADPDRDVVLQIVNTLRNVDPKSYQSLQNVNATDQPPAGQQ